MRKALSFGIASSFFFAFTFLLNRSMNLSGGYWMWGACLRYLFLLPLLTLVLWRMRGDSFAPVFSAIREAPCRWILWSTVGFGLFYLPLCLGSVFGSSWLTAATWEITIVCGVLLTPLFGKKIPVKNLLMAILILAGVFLMQADNFSSDNLKGNLFSILPILLAAFCYPLGNRKMMQFCPDHISTIQRVFAMTLCSWPFWIITAVIAFLTGGMPSGSQCLQSLGVALFSGVIATNLFFHATDLVKNNPRQLAIIEATQCGEVIFTLLGGILILGDPLPGLSSTAGLIMIVAGMILNSLI